MPLEKSPSKLQQLGWFVLQSAWDLLLPDVIEKPWAIMRNFYQCFLASDPEEQKELQLAAGELTEEQTTLLTAQVMEELNERGIPVDQNADEVQELMAYLLESLANAGEKQREQNLPATEFLRHSFNERMPTETQIPYFELSETERTIAVLWKDARQNAFEYAREVHCAEPPPDLDGYEILQPLGQGGIASVYLARNLKTSELRAVKVGQLDGRERFEREIRLVSELNHPHLVNYHEWGEQNGRFWIVMDYLGDCTLADLIHQQSFRSDALKVLPLANQILLGLEALHERGIIHRDIKPGNVMVDDQFRLKLIDFGLIKPLESHSETIRKTATGAIEGTFEYISPEQLNGKPPQPSADIYSFGCVLYEMLTGELPHPQKEFGSLITAIMSQPINFNGEQIPPELRDFLRRCLSRESSERYENATAALREFHRGMEAAKSRLLFERDREPWMYILEHQVLEKYAAKRRGELPLAPVQAFLQELIPHNIRELDETRIAAILPPIFEQQKKALAAERNVQIEKESLATSLALLSPAEISERAQAIERLAENAETERQKIREQVREQLSDAVISWEAAKQREAEDEQEQINQQLAAQAAAQEFLEARRRSERDAREKVKREKREALEKRKQRTKAIGKPIGWGILGAGLWLIGSMLLSQPVGEEYIDTAVAMGIDLSVGGAAIGGGFALLISFGRLFESWVGFKEKVALFFIQPIFLASLFGAFGALFGTFFMGKAAMITAPILGGIGTAIVRFTETQKISKSLIGLFVGALIGAIAGGIGLAFTHGHPPRASELSTLHVQGWVAGCVLGVIVGGLHPHRMELFSAAILLGGVIGLTGSLSSAFVHPALGCVLSILLAGFLFPRAKKIEYWLNRLG